MKKIKDEEGKKKKKKLKELQQKWSWNSWPIRYLKLCTYIGKIEITSQLKNTYSKKLRKGSDLNLLGI